MTHIHPKGKRLSLGAWQERPLGRRVIVQAAYEGKAVADEEWMVIYSNLKEGKSYPVTCFL